MAIIPARGGSKRIPHKNLAELGGKPLIAYTIDAAISAERISRIIVSTDDEKIAEVARLHDAEVPFMRPLEISRDDTPAVDVIIHAVKEIEKDGALIDAAVLLQPTSPFRTGKHIDEAISLFEDSMADTVTSVCHSREHPYYAWTLKGEELMPFFSLEHQSMVRHDLPPAFAENGAIYVVRRSVIIEGTIYGKKIVPYIMTHESSVDIDTPDDLAWAEFLYGKYSNL